jgi:predicted nuclease of predicted toxin-antitoxin system
MKLLLDENLSRRIIPLILDAYPESTQVALLGMDAYSDVQLWAFARDNGYILVTKDSDFNDLSTLYGYPPKVIWLKCGNQTKQRIIDILLSIQADVSAFVAHPELACLEVY